MSEAVDGGSARAVFQTVVLTALVDGRPVVSEAREVAELVALDPRFAQITDAIELGVATRALLDRVGVEDALAEIAPGIVEADRRLAFRLCARVMIADGKTDGDEAMVLGTMQELFNLPHAEVRSCIEQESARKAARSE
jgi:hypothetical protein